jgi:hypothetical protein
VAQFALLCDQMMTGDQRAKDAVQGLKLSLETPDAPIKDLWLAFLEVKDSRKFSERDKLDSYRNLVAATTSPKRQKELKKLAKSNPDLLHEIDSFKNEEVYRRWVAALSRSPRSSPAKKKAR